ncbi:MAG: hypothetical protein NT051_03160 [Candidatus Micrarchaeota archaeon]|nr:hypothetical protein [Candidatus Micrarchaeota archaeon]
MLDTTTIAQPEHYRADALYDMAKEDSHRIERVEFWMPRKMVEETKSTNKERIIQVKRNLDSLESILYRKMKNNVVKSECKQPPMKHLAPLKR